MGASEICIIVWQHVIRQHFGNWLTIGFDKEHEELSVGADRRKHSRFPLFSCQTLLVPIPPKKLCIRDSSAGM